MADFGIAVDNVLLNEGGYVDNANDSGGATNYGISLRFLREVSVENLRKAGIFKVPESLSAEDIRQLTIDQAKIIYKSEFWDHAPFAEIGYQNICNYLFDCAVHHGLVQAVKLMQRAMWAYSLQYNVLVDDGVFGPKTLDKVNSTALPNMLQALMMAERAGLMRLICSQQPQNKELLNGWLKRCYRK